MLLVLAYVVVNTFGAWAVIRRKPWIAGLFMLAAAVLTVAAVALGYALGASLWLVLTGALLASLASLLNARIVLGRVVAWRHLIRAAVGVVVVVLAWLVLP